MKNVWAGYFLLQGSALKSNASKTTEGDDLKCKLLKYFTINLPELNFIWCFDLYPMSDVWCFIPHEKYNKERPYHSHEDTLIKVFNIELIHFYKTEQKDCTMFSRCNVLHNIMAVIVRRLSRMHKYLILLYY